MSLSHFARRLFRRLPIDAATKHRLRARFRSLSRRVRAASNGQRGAETQPHADTERVVRPFNPADPRDIFIFGITDWHFRTQRPQHLARTMARTGRRVFFLSNEFVDTRDPGYRIEVLDPALALYQATLHLPNPSPIYFTAPSPAAIFGLTESLARLVLDTGASSIVAMVEHPYWYPVAKRLPNAYRVYDCMDHHEGFGNVPRALADLEREMLRDADLVLVTSTSLKTHADSVSTRVAEVRNAVEFQHFATVPPAVYADPRGRRILGYYGAIADWFDVDLVRRVAERHPDALVLLIGADTAGVGRALRDLPNVVMTGEVPYATLPFYLHAFDVCLLPFRVTPLTLATNPTKVYEYLAAGKPVVAVDLPEMAQFDGLVTCGQNAHAFVDAVGHALTSRDDHERRAQRQAFAARQTWDDRVAVLDGLIRDMPLPTVSVIVVTYNNVDLTRACLRSLIDVSDYDPLEIVVVDNASSDDTPAYVRALANEHPNVRVILNDKNVGFARGLNAGLAAASGDYLVLLNNDTVVTRGWALTLLRHLQADPSIGLIGPVTNSIGNEARVEMAYTDVREMPAEARRYTVSHMGRHFPIPNAAFFCAMLPRRTYRLCGPVCEEYERGFFEDDDYCRRVEAAGLRVVCADDVFVHHELSASFDRLRHAEREAIFRGNQAIYEAKWGKWTPHTYRASSLQSRASREAAVAVKPQ